MEFEGYYESNYQRFGGLTIHKENLDKANEESLRNYIKVLLLPAGYELMVDFNHYTTTSPSLFFINSNQYLQMLKVSDAPGFMIYYNRDFYCIQIHDSEVACDGLLFNNLYQMPMTVIPKNEISVIYSLFGFIQEEFTLQEVSQEEMIRTYLKQLIIRATRLWKKQHLDDTSEESADEVEFFREFSRLVEIHYREKHSVADYAEILAVASKTLSNKFKRLGWPQPNDIIKERIILEAKRLLNYTNNSVKEIAYELGYDDPAYFNRLFTNKVGDSPAAFRKKYSQGKNVQLR
ncbi:AraC family transcriptional regulator [Fulvivirga maritima]|uniref:helix-turn-helix domain-containing protein n=1 Tax=Fulvivirga maritima TaxID=2904247 RepID=UPI001F3F9C0B|nr:helix-turn-helix domain-containing protein [Fulvivirga maritima]UII25797.1 AraC family transcriptional regulator [Fulvivirga maritima]